MKNNWRGANQEEGELPVPLVARKPVPDPQSYEERFGERLTQERARLDMSVGEFAGRSFIGPGAMTNLLSGSREPSLKELLRLSRMGVDVGFVLTGVPSLASISWEKTCLLSDFDYLDEADREKAYWSVRKLALEAFKRECDRTGESHLRELAQLMIDMRASSAKEEMSSIAVGGDVGQIVQAEKVDQTGAKITIKKSAAI